ncbi:hypothetical protein [Sinorhizobium mexicanum]|uniref:Uncharacterized protein n=1 Tax=Sinorhizobium mexicanum TaxID=375549 RepID=A0A859R1X6_9HYPH|nr:hypothetical protein [Sinorhizobium mexicanum]MBP1884290.1 hypothetical protein [Sinorhizobium mexicanum]QLL64981.1 hypothetical protein FKV68_26780 [Sinorhizobium mexicanum]
MLVFGAVTRLERADALCAAIAAQLRGLEHQPPGIERHAALVGILLKVGELVQGLLDIEFEKGAVDDVSAWRHIGSLLLLDLARLVVQSWRQELEGPLAVPPRVTALLVHLRVPCSLCVSEAEGYSFYGLYPECYAEAAMRSGLAANTTVIGLRSIGTSLSAMVAASIGAAEPVTLRPAGPPFQKRIAVAPRLSHRLLRDPTARFAIVDEGPGLSGSSFGSVADWLEDHGVGTRHIHFFPGHKGGLGPESSSCHRKRWAASPHHVLDADDLLLEGCHGLASWVTELIGPLERPLEDISAGVWRKAIREDHRAWPVVDRRFERRKFLAHTTDGTWLVKFAGLGDVGQRKLLKARLLAEAGFTPPVAGLCHGFLVERWIAGRPVAPSEFRQTKFVEHLGRYLAFRARSLPRPATSGASLSKLCEMATVNTKEALGTAAALRLKALLGNAERYERFLKPVDTDNRLHRWEWLAGGDRGFLKTDALDHSAAHDLVGRQDIAWDLAGAGVELGLSVEQLADLRAVVSEGCSRDLNPNLQAVLELCYLAFQLGLWISAKPTGSADEVPRLDATASRYAKLLVRRLEADGM